MNRFHGLSAYLKRRFGGRVHKIPLDAGFTCPNRDGSLSTRGCAFCDAKGAGTGLLAGGADLAAQWEKWRTQLGDKYGAQLFLAYLQSYSNTYGPIEHLRATLERITPLPQLAGICIGTRPDCLDDAKLDLLADQPIQEIWLDLGLQSARNDTLARINRGHTAETFAAATRAAAERGLKVCAHLIMGLPGEDEEDFLASVDYVNALPIHGIKLHNLFICPGTPLEDMWRTSPFPLPSRGEYIEAVVFALEHLRPEIVVHRIVSDPESGQLVAPEWAAMKRPTMNGVTTALARLDTWQGRALAPDRPMPEWFEHDVPYPQGLFA
ncbi:TIGR01212 family radical SAM protein [Desulfobaculum sp. SPO524]|uniref:TIGR01212 family radical SAM protein n=1 Tax=Desulfobaculum sp. SPO524 TaxID=3378071 RepID=UPI003853F7C0